MNNSSETEVVQKFRRHLQRQRLTKQVKLIYQVSGGMPSERLEEEVQILGNGETSVKFRDQLRVPRTQEAHTKLSSDETREILHQIETGIGSLVPRSEARFLPDSVVGSITIDVEGEEETFYFLVDEEQREAQEKPISSEMTMAIQRMSRISQQLLTQEKGGKDE